MAHQNDPNMNYMCWLCPLPYAAKLKTLSEKEKSPISSLVCKIVCKEVEPITPSKTALKWAKERLEANKRKRARADEITRSGKYRKSK